MRNLAIGDIHGCFMALETLAAFVPIGLDDRVIALGDYVDRGSDSREVLDWLIERDRQGGLIALRGNHEVMMLDARENQDICWSWLGCGGQATLASYGTEGLAGIPEAHWRFLEQTRAWFETETHFFVHANADYDLPLNEQSDSVRYWEKFYDFLSRPHESGKVMVCGHTPQRDGRPKSLGHAVCIDTWAYQGGWLTCLDVASGQYWQANQTGESRQSWLES